MWFEEQNNLVLRRTEKKTNMFMKLFIMFDVIVYTEPDTRLPI